MKPVTRPTLLIRRETCVANIRNMAEKARKSGTTFRPHFKTHQSAEIGEWFREEGIDKITVSSVRMAAHFAANGWSDITIAFPANILEISDINRLAASISLNLLIESIETAGFLAKNLHSPAGIFLKIDTGYHRTGILPENTTLIDSLLNSIDASDKPYFKGFLTHAGHTYHAKSKQEVVSIASDVLRELQELKERYSGKFPDLVLSYGDTPSCSLMEDFRGLGEVRPGNFVFYDLMQHFIGSCKLEAVGVALACPVVAVHPDRSEAVIYGGAVHLSKESCINPGGHIVYGQAVEFDGSDWHTSRPLGYVTSLSQEHGIIRMNEGISLQPGNLVAVIPVHSCLTMDLMISKNDGVQIIG